MWKRKLQNFRDIFQFGDKNLEMRRMASPPALPRREGAGEPNAIDNWKLISNVSSTNLPNKKEKIFSWIFSKDYLQISEGACDWNLFEIFLLIFYCWFYIDFSLDFKIQNENLEKIYSKIFGRRNKFISLVPRSEGLARRPKGKPNHSNLPKSLKIMKDLNRFDCIVKYRK